MIKCLKKFGVNIEIIDKSTIKVEGKNGIFENIDTSIDVGIISFKLENSGTSARFLVSFCCLFKNSRIRFDSSLRMRERPMEDLIDALLKGNNFQIHFEILDKSLPFTISTNENGFQGGELEIKSNISSQFVTSILLSSSFAKEPLILNLTDVKENQLPISYQFITMTLEIMNYWGIKVERNQNLSKIIVYKNEFSNPV